MEFLFICICLCLLHFGLKYFTCFLNKITAFEQFSFLSHPIASQHGSGGTAHSVSTKHALIMDEVDGMAGNEDRGGIQVVRAL